MRIQHELASSTSTSTATIRPAQRMVELPALTLVRDLRDGLVELTILLLVRDLRDVLVELAVLLGGDLVLRLRSDRLHRVDALVVDVDREADEVGILADVLLHR